MAPSTEDCGDCDSDGGGRAVCLRICINCEKGDALMRRRLLRG